jgi:hypothetical protein
VCICVHAPELTEARGAGQGGLPWSLCQHWLCSMRTAGNARSPPRAARTRLPQLTAVPMAAPMPAESTGSCPLIHLPDEVLSSVALAAGPAAHCARRLCCRRLCSAAPLQRPEGGGATARYSRLLPLPGAVDHVTFCIPEDEPPSSIMPVSAAPAWPGMHHPQPPRILSHRPPATPARIHVQVPPLAACAAADDPLTQPPRRQRRACTTPFVAWHPACGACASRAAAQTTTRCRQTLAAP